MKAALPLPFFLITICATLNADAVYLKDGRELKGVVVEDYQDRVVLSTENGEASVFKKEIEDIRYDAVEENLVKLGALYKDKGDYKTALYYYEEARKRNPDMKEAGEGTLLVNNMIFRKRESDLEEQVELKQDTEQKMGRADAPSQIPTAKSNGRQKALLEETTGISLEVQGPNIKAAKVLSKSAAASAGIRAGDTIVSIWGKLISYMQLNEVYGLFLDNRLAETRVVIERSLIVTLEKGRLFEDAEAKIGARLGMEFDGLSAEQIKAEGGFERAGILKGDLITEVAGASTRYMPLAAVYKLIEGIRTDSAEFSIQREIVFWKR